MTEPIVHILLATYQGHAYLEQQLHSLATQTYPHWRLWVSDDGSNDGTSRIVAKFALSVSQRVSFTQGPCKGLTQNFFHLISIVPKLNNNLYAFCDQDDVWLPNKLKSAVNNYQQQKLVLGQPYLYCGATYIVDECLHLKKIVPRPSQPLKFGNALLQNVASGNTMVFNTALLDLMRCVKVENVVIHDWLAYQVATGCNGLVHYDSNAHLLYRQHDGNVIGANTGVLARMKRLQFMKQGQFKQWANQTESAMENIARHLSPEASKQLEIFKQIRRKNNALSRVWGGVQSGLRRQTTLGQISLLVGLFFDLI